MHIQCPSFTGGRKKEREEEREKGRTFAKGTVSVLCVWCNPFVFMDE